MWLCICSNKQRAKHLREINSLLIIYNFGYYNHANQRIHHQMWIACDQNGHRHVTSCPEIDHPYESGSRAAFIENMDQNI
jgi:hypothetical protein